jgi:HAD superfamily hydrolase (TIGR01509 family)
MTKLIIFDLDGVLIDSRENHYIALNKALEEIDPKFVISREEHLSRYDGLSTSTKLGMLSSEKGLPFELHSKVWERKQEITEDILLKKTKPKKEVIRIMRYCRGAGYKVAVASNAIRKTVEVSLQGLGVKDLVDVVVSNQDVEHGKPYPEMYWKCMTAVKALPKDTIIIEDSHIGRRGAIDSCAHLLAVSDPDDLTSEKVYDMIDAVENNQETNVPWKDKKLNVLVPMAGAGSRFSEAGYTFPKPLIEVNGKPMIQLVVENLNMDANFIFIVQEDHFEKYHLGYMLNVISPGCKIIKTNGLTEGAACTTLLAKHFINNSDPLVIANSDQFVEWNSNECMYAFKADEIDGGILTFKATHPKWSYAKVGEDGFVSEVAEKKPISDNATVGIYYWKHGKDYVKYAEQMIAKDIRTNGEFYVCPVFNEAIGDGKKIRVKTIEKMWGLGTPEDLDNFLRHKK